MSGLLCTQDENQISGSQTSISMATHRWDWPDGFGNFPYMGSSQKGHEASRRYSKLWPAFLSSPNILTVLPTHSELGFHRREQRELSHVAVLDQERYEDSHLGGYRRIYPGPDMEKYSPFFKHNGSLFQETAASKAREECARYFALHSPLSTWVGHTL